MSFSSFIKRHKYAVAVASVVIIILIAFITFIIVMAVLWSDGDVNRDKAISIARKEFGCEKVLWICHTNGSEFIDKASNRENVDFGKYAFCIVGQKEGEEIFIIIPAEYKRDKPYIATWPFDYSFTQIAEKFIELGAPYDGEKFDKYPSLISLNDNEDMIKRESEYYCDVTGVSSDEFYARLDVKAIFSARWEIDYRSYNCIVAQENGELKAYVRVS